jgi:lipid-A-disaccharide synthase
MPATEAVSTTTENVTTVDVVYRPLVIGIVVGEVSGDALGADFMRQMNNLRDDIVWVGVGGNQMQAEGLTSVIDMSRLAVMGLIEVIKHLPDLFKARDEILAAFDTASIDMFIGIDAPDFNLRLGKVLKAKGIFSVQYVSPSIWAWREDRIEKIKQATHLVLCLFPFELPVYQKHGHPAVCVGHPLLKTINPALTRTPTQELRRELIWDNDGFHDFFCQSAIG